MLGTESLAEPIQDLLSELSCLFMHLGAMQSGCKVSLDYKDIWMFRAARLSQLCEYFELERSGQDEISGVAMTTGCIDCA